MMSGAKKQGIKAVRYQLELDGLTLRQRQVVELVLHELSNKEIGRQLFITEKTVKFHLSRAMTNLKLEVRTRDFICYVFGHYLKRDIYHSDEDAPQKLIGKDAVLTINGKKVKYTPEEIGLFNNSEINLTEMDERDSE